MQICSDFLQTFIGFVYAPGIFIGIKTCKDLCAKVAVASDMFLNMHLKHDAFSNSATATRKRIVDISAPHPHLTWFPTVCQWVEVRSATV